MLSLYVCGVLVVEACVRFMGGLGFDPRDSHIILIYINHNWPMGGYHVTTSHLTRVDPHS
jgi:hypothetical protein